MVSPRSSPRVALVAIILSVAAVGFVLQQADTEGAEVSKASAAVTGFWPCWLGGECKTPAPESVQKWKKQHQSNQSPKVHAKKDDDRSGMPCMLGGPCQVPRMRGILRWKAEKNDERRQKHRHQLRVAARNGLPLPSLDSHQVEEARQGMSQRRMQIKQRRILLDAAKRRVQAIVGEMQLMPLNGTKKMSKKIAQRVERQRVAGKGVLKHKDTLLHSLTRFPHSKVKIENLLVVVSAAENAKLKATAAMSRALALQKAADNANAHLQHETAKAKPIIDQVKSSNDAKQKVLKKLDTSKRRLRYAKHQVKRAKRAKQAQKVAAVAAKAAAATKAAAAVATKKSAPKTTFMAEQFNHLRSESRAEHEYALARHEAEVHAQKLRQLMREIQEESHDDHY